MTATIDVTARTPAALAREAAALAESGDLAAAARLVTALLGARPQDYAGRKLAAGLAMAGGDRATAAAYARDLLTLDPLDADVLLTLAEATDDPDERVTSLREAFSLEATVDNEAKVRQALGIDTAPELSSRDLGRLFRKAGLDEVALATFRQAGDATLEEAVCWIWMREVEPTAPLIAALRERGPLPLVARLIDALGHLATANDRDGIDTLQDLLVYDPELAHVRRYVPEGIIDLLPLQRSSDLYSIVTDDGALRLEPWIPPSARPAVELPQVAVEDVAQPIDPAANERLEGESPAVAILEDPLRQAFPVRLAATIAACPGVIRAMVLSRDGKVLADAPAQTVDRFEDKLLSAAVTQVWNLEQTVALLADGLETMRLGTKDHSVFAVFNVRPGARPAEVLVFFADRLGYDANAVGSALRQIVDEEQN